MGRGSGKGKGGEERMWRGWSESENYIFSIIDGHERYKVRGGEREGGREEGSRWRGGSRWSVYIQRARVLTKSGPSLLPLFPSSFLFHPPFP